MAAVVWIVGQPPIHSKLTLYGQPLYGQALPSALTAVIWIEGVTLTT